MYTFWGGSTPLRAAHHSNGIAPSGGGEGAMEEIRQARHNLLGRLNSIKMCVFALETMKPHEAIEFLEMIEGASDRAIAAMDAFDEAFDRDPAAAADVISRR
jgi:hypothetical protein